MQIILTNIIQIIEPTKEVLDYCKKELTFSNPDYIKKQRMGFWIGKTPKIIKLYDYYENDIYIPIGCFEDIWKLHPYKEDYKDYTITKKANIINDIKLRDYQKPCANALRKYVNGIFVLPPGLGKTIIGLYCASYLKQKTLWLTHTKDLLIQAEERCNQNLQCTISKITDGECDTSGDIVFATVQTLVNFVDKEQIAPDTFGLIIQDECFPKGTKISTLNGYKKIEDITENDYVYSYNHNDNKIEIKKVNYLFKKNYEDDLYIIKSLSGYKIKCTNNHPIYTDRGYIKAEELKRGDVIYEMHLLWEDNNRKKLFKRKMVRDDEKIQKNTTNILLARLWNKMGSQKFNEIYTIGKRSRIHERKQPDVEKRSTRKSIKNIKRDRTQTTCSWWKWYRNDKTPKNVIRKIKETKDSHCSRISCSNTSKSRKWLPYSLQIRPWFRKIKNRNRNRWSISQSYRTSKTGYEKRYVLKEFRVEDIEIQKQRSFRKFGKCSKQNYVYNIGVEDNHNYFANNILVHNCHHLSTSAETIKMFEKCVNYFCARYKLGLTATLHRADGLEKTTTKILGNILYELKKSDDKKNLIGYYENKNIIELPLTMFQVPAEIHFIETSYNIQNKDVFDTNGRIVYTKLINSLCNDWDRDKLIYKLIQKCKGATIVISERVKQLKNLHGVIKDSIFINGNTAKKKREKMIEEFKQGKYKVLFASYSLVAEGLDIPRLENLIMASPVKDQRLVVQAIGRCQRPYESKKIAKVYDLVDDVSMLDKFYRKRKAVYKKEGWDMYEY